MASTTQKQVVDLISRSETILILPSCPPDGDSLGSAMSLYMALTKLNKTITVVCTDPVPEVLQFLPNIQMIGNKLISSSDFIITLDCQDVKIDEIKSVVEDGKINIIITPKEGQISEREISFNKGDLSYDLIITVDCAELTQLRSIYEDHIEMFHKIPVVNIDHHVSNNHFGKINHVDIMASSTTELLLPMLEDLGRAEGKKLIDEDIATLLLTGIITDTGSFQNANTTPRSFESASQLIAYGARQQEIIQYIYKTKQLSQLKLWGRVLTKIQTDEKYRVVWSAISQQDFRDTGSAEDETGDVIDELMTNAPGAEIVALIKERSDGTISVSLRSTTPAVDCIEIAEAFGGGGHTQAAGFRVKDMDLIEAEYKVIHFIKKYQSKRLSLDDIAPETESQNHGERLVKKLNEVDEQTQEKPKKKIKTTAQVTNEDKFKFKTPKLETPPEEVGSEGAKSEIIYKFED